MVGNSCTMTRISIAEDWSEAPMGRVPDDDETCGQNFREKLLAPALKAGDVEVVIDGTEGYGSSFLEESFGGLVRFHGFTEAQLRNRLRITFSDLTFAKYERRIWAYIREAQEAKN